MKHRGQKYKRSPGKLTKKEMGIRKAVNTLNVPRDCLHRRLNSIETAVDGENILSMYKNLELG